jgi:hypothetical protein
LVLVAQVVAILVTAPPAILQQASIMATVASDHLIVEPAQAQRLATAALAIQVVQEQAQVPAHLVAAVQVQVLMGKQLM